MKFVYELPDLMQNQRYWLEDKCFIEKKRMQGVYALFLNGAIVYIGISVNLLQRLRQHAREESKFPAMFTSFTFVEFEHATRDELFLYETIYIDQYKPVWNKNKRFRRA